MSILSTEYNEEIARRVYGEELLEDIAIEMLQEGESIEKIMKYTKLSMEVIEQLRQQLQLV